MVETLRPGGGLENTDAEKVEMECICDEYAISFNYFCRCLKTREIERERDTYEIIALLERIKRLQKQFNMSFEKRCFGKELVNVPFPLVCFADKEKKEGKLIVEGIPFGQGSFIEIDKAFERMKKMVEMQGVMERTRDKYRPVFEFLKFLYIQLQHQFFPENVYMEPLPYDYKAVSKVMDAIEFRPSQNMIRNFCARVERDDKSVSVYTNMKEQIRAEILVVRKRLEAVLKVDK